MVKSGAETRRARSALSRSGILAALGVIIVAAVCVRLGLWQLDRLEQRRASNQAVAAGLAMPPLSLSGPRVSEIAQDPTGYAYHRVAARGTFQQSGELLLRGRSEAGRPGVHLVAPFVLEDGTMLLVNRGWLPSPDAATADPRPYRKAGPVQIVGLIQPLPEAAVESLPVRIQLPDTTVASYQRIDAVALQPLLGPLPPFYLQVTEAGPEQLPVPPPLPALDNGPHLGYAIQWFSFAAIAVGGFIVVVRKRSSAPD